MIADSPSVPMMLNAISKSHACDDECLAERNGKAICVLQAASQRVQADIDGGVMGRNAEAAFYAHRMRSAEIEAAALRSSMRAISAYAETLGGAEDDRVRAIGCEIRGMLESDRANLEQEAAWNALTPEEQARILFEVIFQWGIVWRSSEIPEADRRYPVDLPGDLILSIAIPEIVADEVELQEAFEGGDYGVVVARSESRRLEKAMDAMRTMRSCTRCDADGFDPAGNACSYCIKGRRTAARMAMSEIDLTMDMLSRGLSSDAIGHLSAARGLLLPIVRSADANRVAIR